MYPYSSNNNGCSPQKISIFGNYYNDTNNSPPSSSSFLLPSPINYIPLEDEAVYSEFLQQHHFLCNHHNTMINLAHEMSNNMECTMGECNYKKDGDDDDDHCDFISLVEPENSSTPRKIIASKKDRHSKINTARGPRDRRMRLSLDVAKKLFGLQDLLGFDKASKTVDWLLTKSRTAILDLLPDQSCSFMGVSNSASSTSECEVLSGTGDQFMIKAGDDGQETTKNKVAKSCSGSSSKKQKEKTSKVRKCVDFHHPLAKETRQKARERARERTIIKRNNKHVGGGQDSNFRPCLDQSMDQDVNRLGSWRPFEESQRQFIDQMGSNIRFNQGFVGDNSSLLMTNNWNPCLFSYQNSSGLTQEHELNDFQITGNSWEGNNN